VVRRSRPQQTVFYYHEFVFNKLVAKENPEQISWLLVHEWLWQFLDDAIDLRETNEYIHSFDFVEDQKLVVAKVFRRLGVGRFVPREKYDRYLAKDIDLARAIISFQGEGFSYEQVLMVRQRIYDLKLSIAYDYDLVPLVIRDIINQLNKVLDILKDG